MIVSLVAVIEKDRCVEMERVSAFAQMLPHPRSTVRIRAQRECDQQYHFPLQARRLPAWRSIDAMLGWSPRQQREGFRMDSATAPSLTARAFGWTRRQLPP